MTEHIVKQTAGVVEMLVVDAEAMRRQLAEVNVATLSNGALVHLGTADSRMHRLGRSYRRRQRAARP